MKPSRDALRTARGALTNHARVLRLLADKRQREMDFRQYDDPAGSAAQLRARADELEGVAQWLDASSPVGQA